MKITKPGLETVAAVATAVAGAVQSVLVSRGIETASTAAEITSGLAVLLGGYHVGNSATGATTAPASGPVVDPPAVTTSTGASDIVAPPTTTP